MVTRTSHPKLFYSKVLSTTCGDIVIEGPIQGQLLAEMTFHDGLKAFRPSATQQTAIVEIADLLEGRVIVARVGATVIGYVTYLYPDPLERWSEAKMDDLLELGAVEVAHEYRGLGLAKKLLEVSFFDDAMNDYIVFSTEYYWHWDLKGTGLSIWDYKEVMRKVMGSVGMEYYATDDPEITSHPANMLMARIGNRVPPESLERFDEIRLMNRQWF
jgi:acetoin utilization protein AcuA